jgi:hypothetical protein
MIELAEGFMKGDLAHLNYVWSRDEGFANNIGHELL